MNIKTICFGAMALSMVAGSAFAAAGGSGTSALDDPAKMQPFYTDSSMKTLRGNDDFVKAWKAMTPDDQTAMAKACEDESTTANPTNTHPEFCSSVKQNGGSK